MGEIDIRHPGLPGDNASVRRLRRLEGFMAAKPLENGWELLSPEDDTWSLSHTHTASGMSISDHLTVQLMEGGIRRSLTAFIYDPSHVPEVVREKLDKPPWVAKVVIAMTPRQLKPDSTRFEESVRWERPRGELYNGKFILRSNPRSWGERWGSLVSSVPTGRGFVSDEFVLVSDHLGNVPVGKKIEGAEPPMSLFKMFEELFGPRIVGFKFSEVGSRVSNYIIEMLNQPDLPRHPAFRLG